MKISELADRTNVTSKTIRYYESIDLLPTPRRQANRYRQYGEGDVERVRLVAGARRLDFALAEIREILDLRDRGEAPCLVLLEGLEKKRAEIQRRISELQELETHLDELHRIGLTFPTDDIAAKECVCHLVGEQVRA